MNKCYFIHHLWDDTVDLKKICNVYCLKQSWSLDQRCCIRLVCPTVPKGIYMNSLSHIPSLLTSVTSSPPMPSKLRQKLTLTNNTSGLRFRLCLCSPSHPCYSPCVCVCAHACMSACVCLVCVCVCVRERERDSVCVCVSNSIFYAQSTSTVTSVVCGECSMSVCYLFRFCALQSLK